MIQVLLREVLSGKHADRHSPPRRQMEQAAQVSRLAHARMLGLLSLLWLADIVSLVFAFESIMIDGPTVMIMFASEVRSAPPVSRSDCND